MTGNPESKHPQVIAYQRGRFRSPLPVDRHYTASHFWVAHRAEVVWRVGMTRFATRMLGEMVDHGFGVAAGEPVRTGQIIGWIEGFKAISDLLCIGDGRLHGVNPQLAERISSVDRDPFGDGWLYELEGSPDDGWMDVHAYVVFLDRTIDRMLEQQQGEAEA